MNKTKKIWLTAALITVALITMIGAILFSRPVKAEIDVQIAETYVIGDSFIIPEAEMTVDGTLLKLRGTLISPDKLHSREKTVVLDKAGQYEIRYEATYKGKRYRESKFFVVTEDLYEVVGMGSVEYGTNKYLDESISGVNVALPQGSIFRINKMIDLSAMDSTDWFIKFFITPEDKGSIEFKKIIIKVIDAYNPNNFLTIENQAVDAPYDFIYRISYAKAGANGQNMVGLSWIDANNYNVLINNAYGTGTHTSFYGTPLTYKAFEDTFVGFKYQPDEKRLLCNGSYALVTDFDDTEFYDVLWNGFSTNQVFIELSFESYVNAVGNIFVTGVGKEDLTNKNFVSAGESEIVINYDGYDKDNLPLAVVGAPYDIFDSEIINPYDSDKKATVKVYYAYGTKNQVEIDVKNGAFVPIWSGEYFIEYSVTDYYGVSIKEVVGINACDIEDTTPLTIAYTDAVTSGKTGVAIKIADYSVENQIGRYNVEQTVELNGEIITTDSEFIPTKAGEYIIKYNVNDSSGRTASTQYTLNIVYNDEIVFIGQPVLPKYFSANIKYTLPSLKAYMFDERGKVEIDCKIRITDDEGQRILQNNSFVPKASNGTTIKVEYVAEYQGKTAVLTFNKMCYEVYDGNLIDMTRLFVSDNASISSKATETNLQYTLSSNGSFEYINPLVFNRFSFAFSLQSVTASAINIYFEGRDNLDEVVKLTYKVVNDGLSVFINDGVNGWAIGKTFGGESSLIELNYTENGMLVDSVSDTYIKITEFLSGEKFDGFTGDWINFRIETEGVTSKSILRVNNICGMVLSDATEDNVEPQLILSGQVSGQVSWNKDFTFLKQYAMDLIDPNVELKISITYNGAYIKDVNGAEVKNLPTDKQYTVRFENYGKYVVTFTAQDCFGNKLSRNASSYLITVIDEQAPTVTLKQGYKTTATVGEKIVLAGIEVQDNYSAKDKIVTMVNVAFNSVYSTVYDGVFTAKETGTYHVFYYVLDEAGNYSVISYDIIVNAK